MAARPTRTIEEEDAAARVVGRAIAPNDQRRASSIHRRIVLAEDPTAELARFERAVAPLARVPQPHLRALGQRLLWEAAERNRLEDLDLLPILRRELVDPTPTASDLVSLLRLG